MMNYYAIVIAAVAANILGGLWYGPIFGKKWMELSKFDKKDFSRMKMKAKTNYFIMFLGSLITAYVLAQFIQISNKFSLIGGATIAFWAWLGFVAVTLLGSVMWENKSWTLWGINASYQLISLLIMGMILGNWI